MSSFRFTLSTLGCSYTSPFCCYSFHCWSHEDDADNQPLTTVGCDEKEEKMEKVGKKIVFKTICTKLNIIINNWTMKVNFLCALSIFPLRL